MLNKEKYAEQTKKHPNDMAFHERIAFCKSFVEPVVLPQCGKRCAAGEGFTCAECVEVYDEWLHKENKMTAEQMADQLVNIVIEWLEANDVYVGPISYVDLAGELTETLKETTDASKLVDTVDRWLKENDVNVPIGSYIELEEDFGEALFNNGKVKIMREIFFKE